MLCLAVEPWTSVSGLLWRDADLKGSHSLPALYGAAHNRGGLFQTTLDTRHFPWCTGASIGGKNATGLRGRYTFRLNALPIP